MWLWHGVDQIDLGGIGSVVAIGNFDGVHRGHQAVLAQVKALARERAGRSVAVTFDPHPAVVHSGPLDLITSLPQRLALLAAQGLDATLVLPYTPAFAATSPAGFVADYLVQRLAAKAVVVGADLRFGRHNSGDLGTMQQLGQEFGFAVETVSDVGRGFDGGLARWSSSTIRELLASGDVDGARDLLGRPHQVSAVVVRGDQRGRQLGFPTANLGSPTQGLIPADGVYAGWVHRLDQGAVPSAGATNQTELPPSGWIETRFDQVQATYPAAISVGTNPTFDGDRRRVEAHIIGRDDLNLYGQSVACDFVRYLRATLRFGSTEALIRQMRDDVEAAWAALRRDGRDCDH